MLDCFYHGEKKKSIGRIFNSLRFCEQFTSIFKPNSSFGVVCSQHNGVGSPSTNGQGPHRSLICIHSSSGLALKSVFEFTML